MKKGCFVFLCFVVSYFCQAQRSEIGGLVGTSFYLGDLNNVPFRNTNYEGKSVFIPAGGIVYRYNFSPRIALKANLLFGTVSASDTNNYSFLCLKDVNGNKIPDSRKWDFRERKLSFSSPVSEISVQIEINFFNVYNVGHKNQISPYLFGGGAIFSFNPQAKYPKDGIIRDLQPIGTEGQGLNGMPEKYKLTSFAIPFGVGFKANIGRYVCVGAEWGLRCTFTKYLDDVGGLYFDFSTGEYDVAKYFADPSNSHKPNDQRYSTFKNDWYSFAGVVITVRIGNEDRICDVKTNVKLKHNQKRKK